MMAVKPAIDHGQELATPEGQAIGFVDTKEQFDAVTKALKAAGYTESKIIALKGGGDSKNHKTISPFLPSSFPSPRKWSASGPNP